VKQVLYVGVKKGSYELIAKFPYKVGIVVFMIFPELLKSDTGFSNKVKTLVDDPFFDLLEISLVNENEWKKTIDYVKSSKRSVDFSLGLQPEILVRGYNPSALDENERKKAEDILTRGVDIAGRRGMKAVALCSGPNVEESLRSKALKSFKRTICSIADRASKYSLPVYVETFDYQWDKKRLIGPLDLAAKFIEEVRSTYGNVYLLWDLSHAPLLNEKPEDLKNYADLIGHIHVGCAKKVNDKLYDWHPSFHRPGAINTEEDLARLLQVLHDIGYRGAISFEVKPEEGQSPLEVINVVKGVLIRAYQVFLEGIL